MRKQHHIKCEPYCYYWWTTVTRIFGQCQDKHFDKVPKTPRLPSPSLSPYRTEIQIEHYRINRETIRNPWKAKKKHEIYEGNPNSKNTYIALTLRVAICSRYCASLAATPWSCVSSLGIWVYRGAYLTASSGIYIHEPEEAKQMIQRGTEPYSRTNPLSRPTT